jgi:hypothetical protein
VYYILDGREPVPCDDVLAWAAWYETADRSVGRAELPGGVLVSTVFLGLDHDFARVGALEHVPVLFETMIFGGPLDEYRARYCTWEEAEAGHAEAVALASRPT